MEKNNSIEDFDLSGLRLGMTVYHSEAGFGKLPMELRGIRFRPSDGYCGWFPLFGLSTIPDYARKREALDCAYNLRRRVRDGELVNGADILLLANAVISLLEDVPNAKCW